jgi:hypothetical protein
MNVVARVSARNLLLRIMVVASAGCTLSYGLVRLKKWIGLQDDNVHIMK